MTATQSLCALALALASLAAQAQAAQAAPAAPTQHRAAPPDAPQAKRVVSFQSALRHYRAFKDEPVANWREANETVLRIGGWRAYAREAYEALRGTAPARTDGPAGAGGHDQHGGHK